MKERFKRFWKFVKENEELIFWMIIFSPVWIPIAIIIIIIAVIWMKLDPPKIAGVCPKCRKELFYGSSIYLLPVKPEEFSTFPENIIYFQDLGLQKICICVDCGENDTNIRHRFPDGYLQEPLKLISRFSDKPNLDLVLKNP